MSIWENIRGFQEFSMCDWPGKVAAVIFLGGCNFRCPTCHNWNLATNPETLDQISHYRIMDYLEASRQWLDGVVISGGEPTITPGLSILLKEIKALGFPINLHTNGSRPEVIGDLLTYELVDLVSVDVKGPWDKYPELTWWSMAIAKAEAELSLTFEFAKRYPGKFHFRTTAVPTLTDEDLAICRSYLPSGHELHIQTYREPEHLKDENTVNNEFGMVRVVDKKTNEDVLEELPAFEALARMKELGISDPMSAILSWGTPEFIVFNNL